MTDVTTLAAAAPSEGRPRSAAPSSGQMAGRAAVAVRRLTAGRRALPDFLIIGAQKAGTTSLYHQLCAHPQVLPAARKEVHYFDLHWSRGLPWYRSHFPLQARMRGRMTGEATPYLLFLEAAPERVAGTLPNVALVAVLRDPVERAWSHFRFNVQRGFEAPGTTFRQALEREDERLASAAPGSVTHREHSYAARGRYAEQLVRWFAHFPRERLLILDFADLVGHPDDALRQVVHHLGLAPAELGALEQRNRTQVEVEEDEGKAWLRRQFYDDEQALVDLLGRRLSWMHPRPPTGERHDRP